MRLNSLVSIILPTWNGAAYVTKAVESVTRQTYRNFELIILDDGSTDETPEIVQKLQRRHTQIVLIRHTQNMGFVKTLNEGVQRARGTYIARIDDDDAWCDEKKLEKQVTFLKEHPDYGLVGGGIIRVTPEGKELGRYIFPERDKDIRGIILGDNTFAHSTVMFRKALWEEAGGYRKEFHFFADWALWLAIGTIAKFYNFPEYFTLYLEKEQGGDYGRRNTHIRRKIKSNLQLAWRYRDEYPGFWKALILAFAKYAYSYTPFRHKVRRILYRLRSLILGSPGYTIVHKKQEEIDHGQIGVIGAGYVGLVTAVCFAELGNRVLCVDRDEKKIENLTKGMSPFYEPGLKELLQKNLGEQRIAFATDIEKVVQACDIIFICVGTPQLPDRKADLSQVEHAVRNIAVHASSDKIVVEKSTVPVNTSLYIRELLEKNRRNETIHFSVVSNPEFLRQGSAISDFLHPDRIVLGFEQGETKKDRLLSLYETIDAPKVVTDVASAELMKHASNTFLALKISYSNLLSRICEKTNADVKEVVWSMGLDKRIGFSFLEAGVGYGGSCFPKDVRAFQKMFEEQGVSAALLQAIEDMNESQKELFCSKINTALGGVRGKTIGVLGLSFKPNTDDMREAPSISILQRLQKEGVGKVRAYDPQAMKNAKVFFGEDVEYCETPYEAARDADALIILTEWDEFQELDLEEIRNVLRQPIVIDGRNIFDPTRMHELGFTYRSIGRITKEQERFHEEKT